MLTSMVVLRLKPELLRSLDRYVKRLNRNSPPDIPQTRSSAIREILDNFLAKEKKCTSAKNAKK